MTTITNNEEALTHLNSQIEAIQEQLISEGVLPTLTKEEADNISDIISSCDPERILNVSDNDWARLNQRNLRAQLVALEATKGEELICAKGRFILIPPKVRLVSPSGFHPDQQVFIKPAQGVLVDRLPRNSNLCYVDCR